MAVINSYPVNLTCEHHVPKPKARSPKPPMPNPPHLTPKERYLLEWLASQAGKSSLGRLPSKAGILAMVRLASKGYIRVPVEMLPAGWEIVVELTKREQVTSDRIARKAEIRRHEARIAARS